MSPQGPEVRLRRDLRGVLAGFGGESAILIPAIYILIRGQTTFTTLLSCLLLVAVSFAYLPSHVRLGDTQLDAGHSFAKGLPYRLLIDRADIAEAREGAIRWYYRSSVPGIELKHVDGTSIALPLSALLSESRRREWIEEINDWASHA